MLGQTLDVATAPAEQRPIALDIDRVRDVVLVRVATAARTMTRDELQRELHPLVSHAHSMSSWAPLLDRDLAALADAGLVSVQTVGVSITDAGTKRAALVLGVATLPKTWTEVRGARLVARALGIENLPPRRLKQLMKADGLKAAIVQKAFGLKVRGVPTAARLRVELARVALRRAFSDGLPADATGKTGLSAKAGRALAGRLANPPRDFPTDGRLITALALEHARARKADLESLQTAILRRYLTKGSSPGTDADVVTQPVGAARARAAAKARRERKPIRRARAGRDEHPGQGSLPLVDAISIGAELPRERPDFTGFVASVRILADRVADGWAGNRKAYISRIWRTLAQQRPGWDLSEVEFKSMLAEAHRRSALVLAHADLKDGPSLADVEASAVVYKNTIFHFVRIED
ncbi:MAG TPA: hypothetical protein PK970_12145 [Hyphomicrobiaceae bacterium]|nr:hypothetical protein [Hyphomicrobiaceae bacterium]